MKRWFVEIRGRDAVIEAPTRSKARYKAFKAYREAINPHLSFHDMIYDCYIYRKA